MTSMNSPMNSPMNLTMNSTTNEETPLVLLPGEDNIWTNNPKIEIKIGDKTLSEIVESLESKAKLICIKLPLNFNMTTLVNKLTLPVFDYRFKNMRLIVIDL